MKTIRKKIIKAIILAVSLLFSKKKYSSAKEKKLANLGCGLQCLPGWINIDGSLTALFGSKRFNFINKILYKLAGSSQFYSFDRFNKIIKECDLKFYDLRKGVPLGDGSADFIFASHFLEHIGKIDGKNFLKECFRSLKKGGILRIVVPDLDLAFEYYKRGEAGKILDFFFYISENWDFSAHKYGYNFDLLKQNLKETGFGKIEKNHINSPDIEFLDVYPEHSLYVECRKP